MQNTRGKGKEFAAEDHERWEQFAVLWAEFSKEEETKI